MALSTNDLTRACEFFQETWLREQQLHRRPDNVVVAREKVAGWEDVRVLQRDGCSFLRITTRLALPASASAPEMQQEFKLERKHQAVREEESPEEEPHDEDEEEDDDEEALPRPAVVSSQPLAVYDIVHSPSYQVPVLYLTLEGFPSGSRPPLDQVYERLVPAAHRRQVQSVGVMGALSSTDHPLTGLPVYFVHPCRTQEAMESLVERTRGQHPVRYLMLWIGTIGQSVGLHVPVGFAERVSKQVVEA